MKGRSHENDVFTPCGRSVHTGEKNGWTDGTARFHVHTHQGSQILHSFSWRFRKYKFHVTVMVAVTRFEVWVRIMGFREATTLSLDEHVERLELVLARFPDALSLDLSRSRSQPHPKCHSMPVRVAVGPWGVAVARACVARSAHQTPHRMQVCVATLCAHNLAGVEVCTLCVCAFTVVVGVTQ